MNQVNLARWAIRYQKNASNPSDTYWLWPGKYVKMDYIDDCMTWKYLDSVNEPDMNKVASALLWEEPRDIQTLILRFKPVDGFLPDPKEIQVCAKHSHTLWEDCRRWKFDTSPHYFSLEKTETDPDGLTLYYSSPIDQMCKIYVVYNGEEEIRPEIEAYGSAIWSNTITADLEWTSPKAEEGELRIQNGEILSVEPVEGITLVNGKFNCAQGKNAVRVTLKYTEAPQNSKTQLTLWTDSTKTTLYPEILENEPVYIPAIGVYVKKSGGPALEEFLKTLSGQTVRSAIQKLPEVDLETSVRVNYADKPLYKFPVPPYEPKMKIDVPDKMVMGQWRLSAWHLLRHTWRMPDGSLCVSIWPFDKGAAPRKDGNEGAACIASESERILRTMDWLGFHAEARDALNYWLDGERATPFFKFAEVMGEDTLANPYNSFNHCSPGYDQKHTSGHGQVLRCIAHHYHLTHDDEWFDRHIDRIVGACRAVGRLRNELKKHIGPDSWCYGLLPPASSGDFGETRIHYQVNVTFYAGLHEVGMILKQKGRPEAEEILREAEDFAACIRSAVEKTIAYCPVKKVGDGTYRRYITWQPYSRGMCAALDWSVNPAYFETVLNGITLTPDIINPGDPIIGETLDMLEDTLYLQANADTSTSVHGNHVKSVETPKLRVESLSQEEEDLLYRGGYGLQCGIEMHKRAYLYRNEPEAYLRAVFNSYGVEIEPDRAYIFWEGPHQGGAPDKTFEEAAFIEYIRWMLVFEEADTLWLCRMTPKKWLESGKTISVTNAPSYYGTISFSVHSDLEHNRIEVSLSLPANLPRVALRLRIPENRPIVKVEGVDTGVTFGADTLYLDRPGQDLKFTVLY